MAGRPPIWEDPEAFDKAVDQYFSDGLLPADQQAPKTWTGLAIHLGFESRQSLQAYSEKPEFSYSIKKALLRIERKYEEAMMKQPAGAIFALKNFGWTDKHEVDQKTTIKDERIDPNKLTDADLRTLAEIQRKGGVSEA